MVIFKNSMIINSLGQTCISITSVRSKSFRIYSWRRQTGRRLMMGVVRRRVQDGADWRWEDVQVEGYTTNNATKQVLIGDKDGSSNFAMHYFTIPPHECSSLDKHERE